MRRAGLGTAGALALLGLGLVSACGRGDADRERRIAAAGANGENLTLLRLFLGGFRKNQHTTGNRLFLLDSFDQNASNGFIEIYGLPTRVAAARDVKFGNGIEVPDNTVE